MAVALLRAPDGRVRAFWRFLLAAVLTILAQLSVFFLLNPGSLISLWVLFGFALLLTVTLGIFAMLSRTLDRASRPLPYIGLSTDVPVARLIAVGFVYGAGMVTVAVLVMAAGGSVSFQLQLNASTLQAAALQLVIFAVAALHEEVSFRGYSFQRLMESIGTVPAILVYAVMFALPHLGNPYSTWLAAFNTAAVGAVFAAAYVWTRSLWLVWGIHWGWNFVLAVGYGLNVSGYDTTGPVTGVVAGSQWVTGGAYGIEGGASGSVAIIAGFAGLLWLVRQPTIVGVPAAAPAAYVTAPSPPNDLDQGGHGAGILRA